MLIARVIGDVVAARKQSGKRSRKLVLVQPLNLDSTNKGEAVVALDTMKTQVGDCVLLARDNPPPAALPVDLTVVGLINKIELFASAASPKNK